MFRRKYLIDHYGYEQGKTEDIQIPTILPLVECTL